VLGQSSVGPKDSIFDLGGHSLLLMRISARILKTFAVEVPIHTFFETPTLEEVAELIERLQRGPSDSSVPPISPTDLDRRPGAISSVMLGGSA
jgi:hypothetical protein